MEACMATDLEDLLKMRTIYVHERAVLYLLVLDTSQKLREENLGFTISKIFSSNPFWVGKSVKVLPDPTTNEISKTVTVELDKSLQPDQMEVVYYDAFEVKDF
jgi:hypothetical protein